MTPKPEKQDKKRKATRTDTTGSSYKTPAMKRRKTRDVKGPKTRGAKGRKMTADYALPGNMVRTNIAGISAVSRLKRDPRTPGVVRTDIARELLGAHFDSTNPNFLAIRNRILARQWRVQDRIIPRLAVQRGVTHLLR